MNPAEEGKLLAEGLALEVGNKADKAEHVQHEADEAVVLGKGDKVGIDKDDVLEVIDDRLAVEEVVGDNEEVPAELALLILELTSSESCSRGL